MADLAPMLEKLLIDRMLQAKTPADNSRKVYWGVTALSLLCVGMGVLFLIGAAYIWFSSHYPQQEALAYTGLICMGLGFMMAGGFLSYRKYRRRPLSDHGGLSGGNVMESIQIIIENIEGDLGDMIRDNPKTSVLVSVLAGLMMGEKIK